MTLRDPPLASYNGGISGFAPTMPPPGQKLDLNSPAAVAYSSYLANGRAIAKAWMNANLPRVQVIREYSIVLNGFAVKLNGVGGPFFNVPGFGAMQYSTIDYPAQNRSPTLVGAPTLWALEPGGTLNAGAGIKIGIIDTGINQTHPFLTDPSLSVPAGFPKCDAKDSATSTPNQNCLFTSNKVIVAKVFQTLTSDDARGVRSHGTHVSGTAAGVSGTCAPFIDCATSTLSGIAPKAWLGNYNVFPGTCSDVPCSIVLAGGSFSHDIAAAVEEAVRDGMDVLNLSLGGPPQPRDQLANAVNAAVDAGVVVAVAAGNAGPAPGTIASPGIAEKVITAGASTNPHFIGVPVTVPTLGTFGAAVGQFANFNGTVTATYNVTSPVNGCSAITNNISGKIALIKRGGCTFTTKVRNAQTAGAVGVIVYNNQFGDPIAMAQDGTSPVPKIPAVMVSNTNGVSMARIAPNTVTINGAGLQEFFTDGPSADIIAAFSSRGPDANQVPATESVSGTNNKIKPDVTAPGVNVYSSVNGRCGSIGCFAFFQGTSMATPHVAGSAALLKQLHPNWSPEQIKSALVTTAARPVRSNFNGAALLNPMDRGGGRINLNLAGTVPATVEAGIGEASISFGAIPAHEFTVQITVTVTDVSGSAVTYALSVASATADGPTITVPASLMVAAGGTATFTATLTVTPSVGMGNFFGDIVLTGGSATLRIPYWVHLGLPDPGTPNARLL